jgi:predicted alpha/beta-fold hydrolase
MAQRTPGTKQTPETFPRPEHQGAPNALSPPFAPFFSNNHLATLAGNFWPRDFHKDPYPGTFRLFDTEPGVRVLGYVQEPRVEASGEAILLHGLEGSHLSGYLISLAQALVSAGFRTTRLNMRTCGGTEEHCPTLYHAGLTSDLRSVVATYRQEGRGPIFLAGFSLGGNVVLKLAGESGRDLPGVVAGVAAVSTPIDLGACCRHLRRLDNFLYDNRFVGQLKARYRRRCTQHPDRYSPDPLSQVRSVWSFDDLITAPHFGFGTAENYYATQSSQNFLDDIQVPALVIQAQDDPLIPFSVYSHPAFSSNRHIQLLTPRHGGHVGFISRHTPRFWVDEVIRDWFSSLRNKL